MNEKSTSQEIIEAADQLFYQKGFEFTSFSDIAADVQISRGNFYFHFKSKDQILDAVIKLRIARTQQMLDRWESQAPVPKDRIRSFVHILIANLARIKLYGCPVGTLCAELAKLNHPAQSDAAHIFTLFRAWLRKQFNLAGRKHDADALAMHVLAFTQGVATLASAFHDEKFLRQEVSRMDEWLDHSLVGRQSRGISTSTKPSKNKPGRSRSPRTGAKNK